MVIQRILRHADVTTMEAYYIETAADYVRNAMTMLENRIVETDPLRKATGVELDVQSPPAIVIQ